MEDVRADPVWSVTPAARLAPGVGSYISVPIRRSDGSLFGTLCAIDPEPRRLTPRQVDLLTVLARLYATYLERDEESNRRTAAEEALRASEARLRALIEGSHDLLIVVDGDGNPSFVSPSVGRLLGFEAEEVLGRPFAEIVHPDDRSAWTKRMEEVGRRRGSGVGFEARVRDKTGCWRQVEMRARASLDQEGLDGGIVLNVRDVTERNAAELERDRLASIVEGARSPIFGVGLDGAVLSWNPAAAALYGIPTDEAVGRSLPRLTPEGGDDALAAALSRVFSGEHLPQVETRQRTAAGEMSDMSLTISPFRERAGPVVGASVIASDVSDLHRARADAVRLHAEIRAMLDATSDGMLLIGADGDVLSVNRAFAQWFALDPEDIVGRPFAATLDHLRRALAEPDAMAQLVLGSAPDPDQVFTAIVVQLSPSPRELALSATPVRTADGAHLGRLFVFRDVSHEREVERTKSEFVSLVSHELRTPLTSIKGYTDLLLEEELLGLSDEHREFLEIVKANADRLVSLVDDLLEASRLESGRIDLEREALDLAPLIEHVAASMRPQIEAKRQEVRLEVAAGLPKVWADPERITQVLTNLISNANKYTPDGGRIAVIARDEGDAVQLEVTDTGIGMSSDELAQLFGKFYRARNQTTLSTRGTGLGLTITKALVEMHGGTVSVASTPGEGTTFGFTLPVATEVAEQPVPNPAVPSSGSILLVEDNADTARLVARYLQRAGHTVLTAATGEDAIELAFVERPALVLLDLVLPDMDGLEVLERLKADQETRAIPVIVLSMLPDEGHGQRLGAVAHLGKPVDERVLLNRISSLVRRDQVSTVLVADDDPEVRRLVATMLARNGYHVVEAANGAEAVAVAIKEAPALALLDVRMPRMDGIEALRKLRAELATRDIAVVMMTANPETLADPSNAIDDLGITDLMHKPFSLDDLLAIVDRVTSGGQTG